MAKFVILDHDAQEKLVIAHNVDNCWATPTICSC